MTKQDLIAMCSCLALLLQGCAYGGPLTRTPPADVANDILSVPDTELGSPLAIVVYGDMRFTDPGETVAATPAARRALVARVASQHSDALFLTGDIPWHGGDENDYQVFRDETASWDRGHLRVYPVLGNHEFSGCDETRCLENWWQAFPQLRGRRWYEVALGTKLRAFALDSNASLLPGSGQRQWFEHEINSLPGGVRFVLVTLHHPPVADDSLFVVRSNEWALATFLQSISHRSSARYIVCSGHVHNYERFERDGITYLVSGGGGAKPLYVHRGPADQFRTGDFPNFHYLRFVVQGDHLTAEMTRLEDYDSPAPHDWAVKDRFELWAKP